MMQVNIKDCKRILIVKLSSIGDVVMTTPVAKALRQAVPDAYIAWAVDDKAKDVLIGNPYLDEIIIWKRNSTSKSMRERASGLVLGLGKVAPVLRSRKFDLVIDFQGLLRSGLVTSLSGARYRVGYDSAREGAVMFYNVRLPSRELRVRGPQQYLNMLQALNIYSKDLDMHVPMSEEDRAYAEQLIAQEVGENKRIAALCPATTWPQKHWTESGWAELADALASKHGMSPVFLGSPADTELVNRIRSLMKNPAASVAGKTTLNQAAALIESSAMTVGVDTGLLHISLALDRPTIGIFGPTRWQHFPKKGNFAVATRGLPCMPCMRHPNCKQYDCMISLTTEDVLAAAEPCLEVGGSWPGDNEGQSREFQSLHIETGMHSLGGPAQVVYLVAGLRDRGHRAVLVCPKGSSVSRHAMDAGVEVITLPLRTDLDFSFVFKLYKIIKRMRPDLVHLHSRRGADIMGGLAARAAKTPAIVLSRRIDNPVRRGVLSKLKYGTLCDRIIAISNGVLNALLKGGVEPSKITCVHSAVQAHDFDVTPTASLRDELGIPKDALLIGIAAQLIERKGHRYLLDAMPDIIQSHPNVRLLVLGQGHLLPKLQTQVKNLGIENNVMFGGFRRDMPQTLRQLDLLVHPATMEGLGVAILQAMAAGLPVVACPVGGIPEAVHDGVNGLLVPPRDSKQLGAAIIRLLSDPELRARMGKAGREIVEKDFSVDSMVEGVLSVYRNVLDQK